MGRILFVTTQYRVGERIYPIIPSLAKKYNLDLVKLYQMDPSWKWPGSDDLRKYFDKDYLHYFDNVYNSVDIDYSKYDLIITDDNRPYNGLPDIYRRRQCLVVACSHGITEHNYHVTGKDKSFDGCFVYGNKEVTAEYHIPAGIPANDELKSMVFSKKKHILIIIGYLGHEELQLTGNSNPRYFKNFDKEVFDSMDLIKLQEKYNKPVVIKLKSRPTTNMQKDKQYLADVLPSGLRYSVLHDVYDDNKLIAESEVVISCPSSLALKSIQLQIPTGLVPHTGQHGQLADYPGIVDIKSANIHTILQDQPTSKYVDNLIQGGTSFNSTKYFINYVEQIING